MLVIINCGFQSESFFFALTSEITQTITKNKTINEPAIIICIAQNARRRSGRNAQNQ